MAKRKTVARTKPNNIGVMEPGEEVTFSSGVKAKVLPFPSGLFDKFNALAFEKFPDIDPPKKQIPVVDGTEEIDDYDDENYVKEQKNIEKQREKFIAEKVLDTTLNFCTDFNVDDYEDIIQTLEKLTEEEYPENRKERKIHFARSYVLRNQSDYAKLSFSTLSQSLIDDPEVSERMRSFQDKMERARNSKSDASGSTGK